MGKAGISLKGISLGPSESVPNPRRARDCFGYRVKTSQRQGAWGWEELHSFRAPLLLPWSTRHECRAGPPGLRSHDVNLAPPLWAYDLSLGISQARDTHTATIQVGAWKIMLSRNPQPSSLADTSPHTNPPHHCNAAIQPGTWPLHPASIHLIGTIS